MQNRQDDVSEEESGTDISSPQMIRDFVAGKMSKSGSHSLTSSRNMGFDEKISSYRDKVRHNFYETKPYNLVTADQFKNILKLPRPEILKFMLAVAASARTDPDNILLIKFEDIPRGAPSEELVSSFGCLFVGLGHCRQHILPELDSVLQTMSEHDPDIHDYSYDGYVLAGSFPVLSCLPVDPVQNKPPVSPSDLDFFPYGDKIEEIERAYANFLSDMTYLGEERARNNLDTLTKRNDNCTTVQILNLLDHQIIHRGYKSPQAVIAGFDQPACKAFYDGFDTVYFALDAALCLYFGINPVDHRRESPSHMRRVAKYHEYGFQPLLIGLPMSLPSILLPIELEKIDQRDESSGLRYEKGAKPNVYARYPNMTDCYSLPGCSLTFTRLDEYDHQTTGHISKLVDYHSHVWRDKSTGEPINTPNKNSGNNDCDVFICSLYAVQLTFGDNYSAYEDSDYGAEDNEINAYFYHTLSMAIKGKSELISVYSHKPTDIIDNYMTVDVKRILRSVGAASTSSFYFGTDIYRDLYWKCKSYFDVNNGGFLPMQPSDLDEFVNMQNRMRTIFDARSEELQGILNNKHKGLESINFDMITPGRQYTASFKPIIRSTPKDYWGPACVDFNLDPCLAQKLTLLCIRKYHGGILRWLDPNIMKLLCKYINWAWMADFLNAGDLYYQVRESQTIASEFPPNASIPERSKVWKIATPNLIYYLPNKGPCYQPEFKPSVSPSDITYSGYVYPWHLEELTNVKIRNEHLSQKELERKKSRIEAAVQLCKPGANGIQITDVLKPGFNLMQTSKLISASSFEGIKEPSHNIFKIDTSQVLAVASAEQPVSPKASHSKDNTGLLSFIGNLPKEITDSIQQVTRTSTEGPVKPNLGINIGTVAQTIHNSNVESLASLEDLQQSTGDSIKDRRKLNANP